jgi:hypothetical protein
VFPKFAFGVLAVGLVGATVALLGGRLVGGSEGLLGQAGAADSRPRALVVPVEIIEAGEPPAVREVRVER